jgi:hypothetical protein
MVLGFVTDEILFHLLDSLGEKVINLFGRAGVVHVLGHHHPDGETR